MPQLVPQRDQFASWKAYLDKTLKPQLALALPRHLTPERMLRITLTELLKSPELLTCDRASFAGAIVQAAQLGLEPGLLGQAYLVPFKGRVQLLIGYRGLLKLARRSGEISTIEPRVVHARDPEYVIRYGTDPQIRHRPYTGPDGPGEAIAYYAVARLKDGATQFEAMSIAEVERHRDRFAGSSKGPWFTDFDAMAMKTVLRRLCKYLPSSIELETAVALDERAEIGEPQGLEALAGGEPDNGSPRELSEESSRPGGRLQEFVREARQAEAERGDLGQAEPEAETTPAGEPEAGTTREPEPARQPAPTTTPGPQPAPSGARPTTPPAAQTGSRAAPAPEGKGKAMPPAQVELGASDAPAGPPVEPAGGDPWEELGVTIEPYLAKYALPLCKAPSIIGLETSWWTLVDSSEWKRLTPPAQKILEELYRRLARRMGASAAK